MALWSVCPRCHLIVARGMAEHIDWHQAITDRLDAADAAVAQIRTQIVAIRARLDKLEAAQPPPPA